MFQAANVGLRAGIKRWAEIGLFIGKMSSNHDQTALRGDTCYVNSLGIQCERINDLQECLGNRHI